MSLFITLVNDNKISETEYLYGCKVTDFLHLRYDEALAYKLERGIELQKALYKADLREYKHRVRLSKVQKAIKHNEKLIREFK